MFPSRSIRVAGLCAALCGSASPGSAASNISTSGVSEAFYTATSFYSHYSNGNYWVAFHDGTRPVIFRSPDGGSWSAAGNVFSTATPAANGRWAVRYAGNTIVAFGYHSDTNRYYRAGTLNANGTISWLAADAAVTGVTGSAMQELNALIVNGKPVMWRAGPSDPGRFTIGSALASPSWTDSADAPALTTATEGVFAGGAIFPTGGADPDDLIVLRTTTAPTLTANSHRLVSLKYDAGTGTFDPGWYNVSTLGGGLGESSVTRVNDGTESDAHRKFAAVRDASGNIHAVYVNDDVQAVHYKKTVGFNDGWSQVSPNVTQVATSVSKVALTALGGENLLLFYEKNGNGTLFWRRFDGTSWGPENFLFAAALDLRQALAPIETLSGCSAGLAFTEKNTPPFDITFSLDASSCTPLNVTYGAGTIAVTAPGSFEWVFDEATGAGARYFYDLSIDPGRTFDLAAGTASHEAYFIDEVRDTATATNYRTDQNDYGAELDLLEATPTRVVLRQEAFYESNGGPLVLGGVKGHGDYAIYPSGKMAIDWTRKTTATINYQFQEIQHSVHYRDPGTSPYDGWAFYTDSGTPAPTFLYPPHDTFTLFQSNLIGQMETDFLNVPYVDWAAADSLSFTTQDAQQRAELTWEEVTPGVLPAAESWSWLTYFKPTTFVDQNDPNVTRRRDDYRNPSGLAIITGANWNRASENSSGDYYNEAEGAYVLGFDPALGLEFRIQSATATNRFDPVFKIRRWHSIQDPPSVSLDGVVLANDVDFRADVKPVSRGHFSRDLRWYSTLQFDGAVTSPDVGSAGVANNGNDFPPARFGNGARFDTDGEYLTFPQAGNFDSAEGAIEFWYQPTYDFGADLGDPNDDFGFFGYYIDDNDYFSAYYQPNEGVTPDDDGLKFVIHSGGTSFSVETGLPTDPFWRAYEWVHLRFVWDQSPQRLEIWVNGTKVTGAPLGSYPAPAAMGPDIHIGDRVFSPTYGFYGNNAEGIIDELHVYSSADAPATMARGGLASDTSEYLATGARNFGLDFFVVDGAGRGEYAYFGSDSEFLGLNIFLATPGAGVAPVLRWEFWNGMQWTLIDGSSSLTDGTDELRQSGTIHWTDLNGWAPYSVNGAPDLYYVRASLASGSYSTLPVEGVIRTDILLFQYCGVIDADNQTFLFGLPVPTAVELASFEATPADGAVVLTWETASELQNLGFELYRSTFPDGPYSRITTRAIPGLGSSPTGARYRHVDSELTNGVTYFYLLEDIETTGETKRHGPVEATPLEGLSEAPQETPEAPRAGITYGEPTSTLVTLREDSRGAVVELRTSGFYAEPNEEGAVSISVAGLEELEPDDGAVAPSLPAKRFWLDATPGRRIDIVSVSPMDVERFTGLRPATASTLELEATLRGAVHAERRRSSRAYQGRSLTPSFWARVVTVAYQGGRKRALIEIAPLRWNGAYEEILLARRLEVRLSFRAPDREESLERNGDGRRRPRARRSASDGLAFARLVTRERGVHAVSYEALFPRGRSRLSESRLTLSRLGRTVPFHVEPNGVLTRGATLYFWSDGADANPYGDEAVYELSEGPGGLLMSELSVEEAGENASSSYRHTTHREENHHYQAGLVSRSDPWLWELVLAPDRKDFTFEVVNPVDGGVPARLRAWVQGASDVPNLPDHHVRLFVNGVPVVERSWNGKLEEILDTELPPGILREGVNTLTVENVGDAGAPYSLVMLDRFEVSYDRATVAANGALEGVWRESGVTAVSGLPPGSIVIDRTAGDSRWRGRTSRASTFAAEAGHAYVVTAPDAVHRPEVRRVPEPVLKRSTHRADYLILGPEALLPGTRALAELRRTEGLGVEIVSLESIYAEFGFGERSPDAIRDFITYAYHEWRRPSPRYVLLVGDASYDFKDYLGTGAVSTNHLLPYIVRTHLLWTASDAAYASVNGDDSLPDLALGRLPAASLDELRAMVAKILAHETASDGRKPGASTVLVADNRDAAGDFEADAEAIAREVLAGRDPERIYLGELGVEASREAIRRAFEHGASMVSYLGHGGIHLWADENLLDNEAVDALGPHSTATATLPIVLSMNCLNGYFHFPYIDSLSERLVEAEGRGAVAAFSPSGLSLNGPAQIYHLALVEELVSGSHERLGDAILAAQRAYASSGAHPSLLAIYNLLGDPALSIH